MSIDTVSVMSVSLSWWIGVSTHCYADRWLANWRSTQQTVSLSTHAVSTSAVSQQDSVISGRCIVLVLTEPGCPSTTVNTIQQVRLGWQLNPSWYIHRSF